MAMPDVSSATSVTIAMARTRRMLSRAARRGRPRGSKLERSGLARPGSVFGEGIADAPDGPDVARLRGIGLDLIADVADVDVDRSLVLLEGVVVVPHQLQQLSARVHPARPGR